MTFDDLDQWLHRIAPPPMFWVVTIGIGLAALALYLTVTLPGEPNFATRYIQDSYRCERRFTAAHREACLRALGY